MDSRKLPFALISSPEQAPDESLLPFFLPQHYNMMKRIASATFGFCSYLAGLYATLSLVQFGFHPWIDFPEALPVFSNVNVSWFWKNIGFLALFALQHSLMARKKIKKQIQQWIPATLYRSCYILLSAALVLLLVNGWQPVQDVLAAWQFSYIAFKGLMICILGVGDLDYFSYRPSEPVRIKTAL